MKAKNIFLAVIAGAAMLFASSNADAQAKAFQTKGGAYDTIQYGGGTLSMYCVNYNPAQEVQVQIEVASVGVVCADSLYGIATVWGSDDNVTYVQLYQQDLKVGLSSYNPTLHDSLSIANTVLARSKVTFTSTGGGQFYTLSSAAAQTYIWTYNMYKTLQPLPRYFKLTYNNKLHTTANDSTFVAGTLYVNP